jgi:hypothetical protein
MAHENKNPNEFILLFEDLEMIAQKNVDPYFKL